MKTPEFLEKIRREESDFLKAPIYLYGTEAIGSYYKVLNLNGKSVLTINGSGDQVLNAYYFGAKRVVGFDIIKDTKYMLDLKIAAIKGLNRDGFLRFFGSKKDVGSFDREIYSSLEKYLDVKTMDFFNNLFEEYNGNGRALLDSDNFRERKEFYEKLDEINPFLASDDNYEKMQKIVSDVEPEFVEADIRSVHEKVGGVFDVINLSNVLNYISKDYEERGVENPIGAVYEDAIVGLKNKLSKDGKIIFYSFYRAPEEIGAMPLIGRVSSFEWIARKGDFKVSKIKFNGILNGEDFVTVLEQKR